MNRDFDPDFHTASALGSDAVMFDNFPSTYEVIGKITPVQLTEEPVKQVKEAPKKLVIDPNKKYEYKSPSLDVQVKAFKDLFFSLHFERYVTMNETAVFEILGRIDNYVTYHSTSVAQISEYEHQQNINHGFWRFIMNDPEKGLREVQEKVAAAPAKKATKKVARKSTKPRKPRVTKDVTKPSE